jgi:thiol-disulfide isomerase/thioredoxin
MRTRGAPEARGFSFRRLSGTAIRAGALAFLTLTNVATPHSDARAEAGGDSPMRRLVAVPNAALPSFILPDLAGAPLRLDAQRGHIILVHFFATWCEPCREELASLSLLQQSRRGRIAIVAVNVAEVPMRVRRFLDAAPVAFSVALDTDRAVTRAWGVAVLPTTFVLDAGLQPRLFVEGDLDWSRPDILSALDAVNAAPSSQPGTARHHREE